MKRMWEIIPNNPFPGSAGVRILIVIDKILSSLCPSASLIFEDVAYLCKELLFV